MRYNLETGDYPEDWDRHPVFVTDEGIVPMCDLCDGPQRVEGDLWNGDTGNHYSCEMRDNERLRLLDDVGRCERGLIR